MANTQFFDAVGLSDVLHQAADVKNFGFPQWNQKAQLEQAVKSMNRPMFRNGKNSAGLDQNTIKEFASKWIEKNKDAWPQSSISNSLTASTRCGSECGAESFSSMTRSERAYSSECDVWTIAADVAADVDEEQEETMMFSFDEESGIDEVDVEQFSDLFFLDY